MTPPPPPAPPPLVVPYNAPAPLETRFDGDWPSRPLKLCSTLSFHSDDPLMGLITKTVPSWDVPPATVVPKSAPAVPITSAPWGLTPSGLPWKLYSVA